MSREARQPASQRRSADLRAWQYGGSAMRTVGQATRIQRERFKPVPMRLSNPKCRRPFDK